MSNLIKTFQELQKDDFVIKIKTLIWVYFWLLIFEGTVRKWLFLEYARPLLIIRDPFLIIIYVYALRSKIFPLNGMLIWLLGMGFITLAMSILSGKGTLVVAIYGFRVNYLHFPLCFIMMDVFGRDDVIKIGKMFLWLALPMAILMMVQFMSPPNAWVNNTAGGEGTQIRATIGNVRPPGTFSFVTGVAEFLPLVTAFLIYAGLSDSKPQTWLLVAATVGLIGACVVSISRLAITNVCIVLLIGGIVGTMRTQRIVRMFVGFFFVLFIIALLTQFDVIRLGFSTFGDRIQAAGGAEGGWGGYAKRITKVFYEAIDIMPVVDLLGEGLGVGTQGGATLITGKRTFLLAEGEWSRIIIESGPLFGGLFLLWRICLGMLVLVKSINCLRKGDLLPILISGACMPLILIGQIGRATTLGFTVFSTGLCMAAIGNTKSNS